jgi:hypothetical protein
MNQLNLNLKKHNTLRSILTKEQITQTERIVISGFVGYEDFNTLALMCKDYKLFEIDMSDAVAINPDSIYMDFSQTQLLKIALPHLLKIINLHAFSNTSLDSIQIPASVYEIGEESFQNTKIKEIYLPATVRKIKQNAFGNSELKSVTIASAIEIESNVFNGCKNLVEINIHQKNPPYLAYSVFEEYHFSACTLYVPPQAKQVYEKADGWIKFENIREKTFPADEIEKDYVAEFQSEKRKKENVLLIKNVFILLSFFLLIIFLLFRCIG